METVKSAFLLFTLCVILCAGAHLLIDIWKNSGSSDNDEDQFW